MTIYYFIYLTEIEHLLYVRTYSRLVLEILNKADRIPYLHGTYIEC